MALPSFLSMIGFTEIPGCEQGWTRSFSCSLTLMRAPDCMSSSAPARLLISPLYQAQQAKTLDALARGQEHCQPETDPGMELNPMLIFFQYFLPLMSPADGQCFHCFFPSFFFLTGVCSPARLPTKTEQEKNRREKHRKKNGKQDMKKRKNLRAGHNGLLRFWDRFRKRCLFVGGIFASRVNWITIYAD